MSDYANALGRLLLSIVFIYFGYLQFTNIAGYAANPAVLKFIAFTGNVVPPTVIAYLVAAVDLFGGLMLLVGFKLRWAALVLFVFVALTLFFAHPFWTMEGPVRVANQGQFLKNLALMGAMLLMAFGNPGRCSLDGRISAR
jgi:putative oxidoreductase